ncbi:MAG TPA: heavy metal translocating P-type ATPase metal-binding domain-containing protein, partial [Polyangiaceae bacterium]
MQSLGARPPVAKGASADSDTACAHCGLVLESGATSRFCCVGCEAVYRLLTEQHLDRYYDLRGNRGLPVVRVDARRRDRKWLEAIETRVSATEGVSRVEVDVQGLHCSACVWLFEELFRREAGGVSLLVNPTVGRMTLAVEKPFSVLRFLEQVEAFGYLVGPRSREDRSTARPLLFRLGLCAALTMNAMIFAFALYAGLATGPIFRLFQNLELALGTAAVVIGGSVFFRSAFAGLKRRVLHLDLPIALGIAAAYAGSIHGWATGRDPYFDTLCVFITLMLVGRYLQQRALEKNRHMLLEGDDVSGLLARRLDADGTPRVVPCTSLSAGDRIVVAPFDLVPVDGIVEVDTSCSLDWINGESRPRTYARGATVPAGAFNAGSCAFVLRAGQGFADSSLT